MKISLGLGPSGFIGLLLLLGGCATSPSRDDAAKDLQAVVNDVRVAATGGILQTTDKDGIVFAIHYDAKHRELRFIGNVGEPEHAIACLDGPPPSGIPKWCHYGVVRQVVLAPENATQIYWAGLLALWESLQ